MGTFTVGLTMSLDLTQFFFFEIHSTGSRLIELTMKLLRSADRSAAPCNNVGDNSNNCVFMVLICQKPFRTPSDQDLVMLTSNMFSNVNVSQNSSTNIHLNTRSISNALDECVLLWLLRLKNSANVQVYGPINNGKIFHRV